MFSSALAETAFLVSTRALCRRPEVRSPIKSDQHFDGGQVGMAGGGDVVGHHLDLLTAGAAQGDLALAVLRGLLGVGGRELAGGPGNGAEGRVDRGEGLEPDRTCRPRTSMALSGW